jgi:hypothetical protein
MGSKWNADSKFFLKAHIHAKLKLNICICDMQSLKTFMCVPGLPDGIFAYQKCQFGLFMRGLKCNMLVYFMAVWYIVCPFGIFYVLLVFFSRLGMLYQEKSGIPGCND